MTTNHSLLSPQRRLAAELLAYTITQLFPNALCLNGKTNSVGFSYDFVFEQPVNQGVFEYIESQLRTLIKEEKKFRFLTMMRGNAENFFTHHQQDLLAYQVSLISENIVEIFQLDNFYSICPQLPFSQTNEAGYVKLLAFETFIQTVDQEELSVTRISGTSFDSPQTLKRFCKTYDHYLRKSDHRLLGPKLGLFEWVEEFGALENIVWHPKGVKLCHQLKQWVKDQTQELEEEVRTPGIERQKKPSFSEPLTFDFKKNSYYFVASPLENHLKLLKGQGFDYQPLPIKLTEYFSFSREEGTEEHGLYSQGIYQGDWTTVYCSQKQVVKELTSSLQFIEQIIRILGFEAHWVLVASSQKGSKGRQQEQLGIEFLKEAIQAVPVVFPLSFEESEEEKRGPRLEIRLVDQLGRAWPASFLEIAKVYFARGKEQTGVVVAKSIWGSLDRWVALLVEQQEGIMPFWLAPEQVRLLVVGEVGLAYAKEISQSLMLNGIRVKLDQRSVKLDIKVHAAEREKIPYLVIVGEKEQHKQGVSVRTILQPNRTQWFELKVFLDKIYQESLSPVITG
jgi:threonyl-tRNA synthetase